MNNVNIGDLNRGLSLVGGVASIVMGLKGDGVKRAVLLPVGAEMIRRGISGHCYLSEVLQKKKDSDRADRMSEESFPASDPPSF